MLEANQAQLLLAAGNPVAAAAPVVASGERILKLPLRSSSEYAALRHANGVEVSWPGHYSRRHQLHPAVHEHQQRNQPAEAIGETVRGVAVEAGQRRAVRHGVPESSLDAGPCGQIQLLPLGGVHTMHWRSGKSQNPS